AAVVAAGRGNDVPAVASDVDAGTEAAPVVVADPDSGVRQVEVEAAGARPDGDVGRNGTVAVGEVSQRLIPAVGRVDVDDDETAYRPGSHGDVGGGPPCPPAGDDVGIRGGSSKSSGYPGMLPRRRTSDRRAGTGSAGTAHGVAGKDRPAASGVGQGGIDRGGGVGDH